MENSNQEFVGSKKIYICHEIARTDHMTSFMDSLAKDIFVKLQSNQYILLSKVPQTERSFKKNAIGRDLLQ